MMLLLPVLSALVGMMASRDARAEATVNQDGKWRGLIGISMSFTEGNSVTRAALANLDLSKQHRHDKTSILGYLNESTNRVNNIDQTTAGKWGLSGQYDRDLTEKWFAFSKLGFDGDRLIQLKLRSTVSAGAGYHVIQQDAINFDMFTGLSYTDRQYSKEQFINGHSGTHFASPGGLLGEESSHQFQFNDKVTFKQRLEFYPDFSGDKAHVIKFNAALNVSITQTFSLSLGVISTYNRIVPPGVKNTDTSVFTGINMKLGT